jgi:LPXTG-site transpeptidase (sortase) family protein
VLLKKKIPFATRMFVNVVPALCIIVGIFLVGNATWPLFSYFLFSSSDLQTSLLSPIPRDQVLDIMPKVVAQAAESNNAKILGSETIQDTASAPVIMPTELDYTNLSNWFPNSSLPDSSEESTVEYQLDIPAVNIENARIKMGGTNLDHNLIQYPGTAMPGQSGEPVIFGHSVLRQFYNPSEKNPRRYFSIFSKIMTLKPGDKIYLTYDNIKYTYEVREHDVVDPDDTAILEQRYDMKALKLVTCYPEGTYLKRGVVTAELVSK